MSSVALWTMDKAVALNGERRHLHKGPPVPPGFVPPPLAPTIQFGRTALAAAIARTATLRHAPPEVLARIRDSALAEAEVLVADGPGFALSPYLATLADSERTHFAARVGAGITDLYMNALGYAWRDNAAGLAAALQPHADFLYHGGNAAAHGLVLAEARGSFAASVTDAMTAAAAERKYMRQVRPYINAASEHGEVIHGYAVAFGCQPGAAGAYLRLSQTRRTKPKGGGKPSGGPDLPVPDGPSAVPTGIALAAHRSNFVLMDALPVAAWIDWISGRCDFPEAHEPVLFLRIPYAGRMFLACADMLAPYPPPFWDPDLWDHPLWWRHWERRSIAGTPPPLRWFVMEERAALSFLGSLTDLIRSEPRERPPALALPTGDIVGFADVQLIAARGLIAKTMILPCSATAWRCLAVRRRDGSRARSAGIPKKVSSRLRQWLACSLRLAAVAERLDDAVRKWVRTDDPEMLQSLEREMLVYPARQSDACQARSRGRPHRARRCRSRRPDTPALVS